MHTSRAFTHGHVKGHGKAERCSLNKTALFSNTWTYDFHAGTPTTALSLPLPSLNRVILQIFNHH